MKTQSDATTEPVGELHIRVFRGDGTVEDFPSVKTYAVRRPHRIAALFRGLRKGGRR